MKTDHRHNSIARILACLAIVLLLVLSSACTSSAPEPTKAPAGAKTEATAKPASPATPASQATVPAKATAPAKAAEPSKEAVKPLDPPVNIKFGTLQIAGDAGLFIALERGYFKEEGINIELVRFRSAADVIAPLATGELDFGAGSINPGYFNAVSRGLDLRIVADKVTWAYGMAGGAIIVRKDLYDSGVKDISKLKGKNVAVNLRANSSEMYLDLALRKVGLTIDDVNVVTLGFPDMMTALANKGIDAAYEIEPFVMTGKDKGISETMMGIADVEPGEVAMAMIVSPVFAQKNPEAVRRVVTAHLRGQRDYFDAFVKGKGDKESIIAILAKNTDQKDPEMYKKMGMHAVMPNGTVDPKILAQDQDYFVQRGWLKDKVDIAKLVDTQYIDYAVKRLGKYDESPR